MEFFENWPLEYYRTLRLIKESGLKKMYYNIDKDVIITEEESKKYEEKPYRKSETYMIVGRSKTVNEAFKELNRRRIPEIPKKIKKKIDERERNDKLIRIYGKKDENYIEKEISEKNEGNKVPKEIAEKLSDKLKKIMKTTKETDEILANKYKQLKWFRNYLLVKVTDKKNSCYNFGELVYQGGIPPIPLGDTKGKIEYDKCKKRYSVFNIALRYEKDNMSHATLLIIDHVEKLMEYMNPHGINDNKFYYHLIETSLIRYLSSYYPDYNVNLFDRCPLIGPQSITNDDFCSAWILLYSYLRLNDGISSTNIFNWLTSFSSSKLHNIIRNFINYLYSLVQSIDPSLPSSVYNLSLRIPKSRNSSLIDSFISYYIPLINQYAADNDYISISSLISEINLSLNNKSFSFSQ